ncbi:hypothetical protein [Parablautia sp. Marseille-Q6255]|uniref:hypothetical protein n=1 Tax=Parablautia sp. Marseille-Q6255 TaxID=3039593 RepID=UPI0024BC20A6|nr:hypothetical protein [Parablautia sp. Marseille-Q6255]
MVKMTNEAATVLHALYSQFLSRRKVGQSKNVACHFGSVQAIHDDLCPQLPIDDVDSAMRELDCCGYLINDYGDQTICLCALTNEAIIDCQNLTKDRFGNIVNGFATLADFISALRP